MKIFPANIFIILTLSHPERNVRLKNNDNIKKSLLEMKVCEMKFLRGYDQEKIGKILGCSRATVSRLLNSAIKNGIAEIHIKNPLSEVRELEEALKKKYFLKKVIVVKGIYKDSNIINKAIGTAAAELASNIMKKNYKVGISCGHAVYEMLNSSFRFRKDLNLEIVPLLGGYGLVQVHLQVNELARMFANIFNGKVRVLDVPFVLKSKQARDLLVEEKRIKEIIKIWGKLDVAFVGIGNVDSMLDNLDESYISKELRNFILLETAGNICGRFFDKDGNFSRETKDYNIIAINFKDLINIPLRVGIAGGQDKIVCIRGALSKKLINILVTDENTATEVLKK